MNKTDKNIQPLRMVISPMEEAKAKKKKKKKKKSKGEVMRGGLVIFNWVIM